MNGNRHDIAAPSEWVVRWSGLVPAGGRVLDIACGNGRHARFFASRGHPVEAVDRDPAKLAPLAGIPGISARSADLEEAAEGIMRSAFGFGGQKCSANSRVYVEQPVHDELVRLLVEKTEKITIGNPIPRDNWLGPIIDAKAVARHQAAVGEARRDGTIFTGGEHLTDGDLGRGFYVEPTVVGLGADHRLFRDELFAPFTAVAAVDSLDEALARANDSTYGLTAGVYSEDPAEVERFLDEIHAGVLYVNRRAGATTGAWPGVQAFGGWKGSGSTGKAGLSMYYVAQFMREQSHTVVE